MHKPLGSQNSEQAKLTLSIQKAAVAALSFRQGDATSFSRARADFTADGWKDFLTHMQGFLDAKGAPTFTSSFVVKHDARLLDERNDLIHLRIPGSLTQSNKLGRTVYDPAAYRGLCGQRGQNSSPGADHLPWRIKSLRMRR
ncbi:MAG TPA: hypothetical protein VG204_09200 [Terriglobia bacterium]|nr:hypothetical protein [Terriglobia bacterium]